MKNKKHYLFLFILIPLLIVAGLYLITAKDIPKSEYDIILDCGDMYIVDAARCVRDNVETFYNYNITDEKYYDFVTLKNVGGDCYNYAIFYDDIFRKLGFNSKTIHIDNGVIDHRITIVSDEDGYCVVDLLNVNCWVE